MKNQNYRYRPLVKLFELALVVGIVLFSFDALYDFFSPVMAPDFEDDYSYSTDSAYTNYWEGRHQSSAGNYDSAYLYYSEAISLNEYYADAYLGRGIVQERGGDYAAAGADFQNFINYNTHYRIDETFKDFTDTTATLDIEMRRGQVYMIPFNVNRDRTVEITATSDTADPILVLLDPDNHVVTGSDDTYEAGSGYRNFSSMNASVPATALVENGIYRLMVSHAGGSAYGDITVMLTYLD